MKFFTPLLDQKLTSTLNKILVLILFVVVSLTFTTRARAEVKNEAFKTTFATTTGTTNTTTLALSGTIDKVYIKIPKVDAAVRYAFEDKETGYRFLSGIVSGSASAVTITEVDLTDTRYSGVLELKLYCDRASADTQQSIIGNLIYY